MSAGPPGRIVSLVPSSTESLCAFGAAARVVGCTRYCVEPEAGLQHAARVGGTKNPNLEAVAALRPDLVVANAEENRVEDLEWLGARFPLLVQTPCTIDAAVDGLLELAAVLGCGPAASPIVAAVAAERAEAAARAAPPMRAYYAIWAKPWMTVGAATFVHDVLRHAGFANVAADARDRYPAMTPAEAAAAGVHVVLLASEPWAFDARQLAELEHAGSFGDARLVLCDGRDFCWHGARMAQGLRRARRLRDRLT